MSNWEALASGSELEKAKRNRRKGYIDEKHLRATLSDLEAQGWELQSEYKDQRYVKVRKPKRFDVCFENRVWMMLYSMGYTTMNVDRNFAISYGKKDESLTKQIDVFAFDGETALVVECKAAEDPGTKRDFKTDLEAIGYYKEQIAGEVRNKFGRGTKIKFIFATSNCVLSEKDKARLDEFDIEHFDEEAIDYYTSLAQHLGRASKYQLLGKLFANTKIDNMKETVPAIRGTMGGHTYYSFSIEPERLLKIGYVLHRSDANKTMMPTYQRVIKKTRLHQVREFVEDGGYFPNSVIISIEAPKRGLKFDIKPGDEDSIAQLGILHLPKKYCSAYIIDGQHRLYGYSDSVYASTNTIPVVAFENLDKEEQIRLFMDINENQKAVPKNLRNTLSADLLWTSDSIKERRKALRLKVAEALGEEQDSPLYNHVLIGENKKTAVRCITMDSIDRGINAGKYLSDFDKNNGLNHLGLFDNEQPSNEYAYTKLYSFLCAAFGYFKEKLPEEWEDGENNTGILTNNSGISALLRIFSDILEFLNEQSGVSSKTTSTDKLVEAAEPLFSSIVKFYANISPELQTEIKTQYGGNGPIQHWRYLQKAIHEDFNDFNPSGFEAWCADNSKQYNDAATAMLADIRDVVVSRVHEFLDGSDLELPFAIKVKLNTRVFTENEKRRSAGEELVDEWDLITLSDCRSLVDQGSLWSDGLKSLFTRPEQVGRKGGNKSAKTRWLEDMHKIQEALKRSSYSVKQADYEYICSIDRWLKDTKSE